MRAAGNHYTGMQDGEEAELKIGIPRGDYRVKSQHLPRHGSVPVVSYDRLALLI